MSRYETSSLLRARLLNYFEGQTGDLGKSRALLQQTLLRLHGAPAGYATDSDVMPRALEIARDLMVAAHRRTPGELMSGKGEESAKAMGRLPWRLSDAGPLARWQLLTRVPDDEVETLVLAMQRCAEGDSRALEPIDDVLTPLLQFYFVQQTGDRAITEELVERTLQQLHATPMNYATESDISHCLFGIARDALVDARRRMDKDFLKARPTDRRVDARGNRDEAEQLDMGQMMMKQPAGAALGANHPVWRKLYGAVEKLAWLSGSPFAFVIDGGNGLWCVALPDSEPAILVPSETLRAAERFYKCEIVPRLAEMRRGKHVYIASLDGADRYLAATFAGIYAVVVWFKKEFDLARVRAKLQRMLPEIQAQTLALPPWDGPGSDEGAVKARA